MVSPNPRCCSGMTVTHASEREYHERQKIRTGWIDRCQAALASSFRFASGEAVEQSRAAGADQRLLAAALAGVHGVPGRAGTAGAVVVSELGGAGVLARPVVAGVIRRVGEGAAVELRAG